MTSLVRGAFSLRLATEEVKVCDLCGADSTEFVRHREGRDLVERLVAGEQRLLKCRSCRLVFLSPRPIPAEIGRVYPEDYFPHLDQPPKPVARWQALAGTRGSRPGLFGKLRVWVRENSSFFPMPRWTGDGKILDVGCGNGTLLDTLKQLGWETHGRDPSAAACEVARRKGHDVRQGTAEDLDGPSASFDVVYLNQVLEHTYSPARALANIFDVLRPGGILLVTVPNYGGVQMRLLGRYSSALDLPRHLYQFDRRTLRRYLEASGFDILRVRTRTGAQSYTKAIRLIVNDVFGTAFRSEPGWVSRPFELLAFTAGLFNYFGAGRDLRVTARKPENEHGDLAAAVGVSES